MLSVSFKKGITACYCLSLLRYIPIFKHNQDVHNFCITANDFGEVHDRNANWLKVPLNVFLYCFPVFTMFNVNATSFPGLAPALLSLCGFKSRGIGTSYVLNLEIYG